MSAFKAPLDPSTALGGFPGNNYSEVIYSSLLSWNLIWLLKNEPRVIFPWQASAFMVTYPVNNAIDKEVNVTQRAVAWEKAFIQLVKVLS